MREKITPVKHKAAITCETAERVKNVIVTAFEQTTNMPTRFMFCSIQANCNQKSYI